MQAGARRALLLSTCVTVFAASTVRAAVINETYTGTFPAVIAGTLPDQGSVLEEAITLTSVSDLTAYTTSYAAGGFQPNIFLFNPAGTAIGASSGQAPPNGGSDFDAYLSRDNLAAGTYTLALTDFNLNQSPTATNLSDGFTVNYGNGSTFIDINGATRTGDYSLTVDATTASATPEPATATLVLVPILWGVLVVARKRLACANKLV